MWQQSARDDYSVYILVVLRIFVSAKRGVRQHEGGEGDVRLASAWLEVERLFRLPDHPRTPPPQDYTLQVSEKASAAGLPNPSSLHVARHFQRFRSNVK